MDSIRKDAMFRQIWKRNGKLKNKLWISILGSGKSKLHFFSRENSLVTLRNQNKHCNLTEKIQLLEFQFSREKYSNILLDELIFAFLLQALMFSTTSMTGSGGFTPGTPVSTHFKRLSKKHREIHHKRYKKNRLEKNSKLNGKLFLKIRK